MIQKKKFNYSNNTETKPFTLSIKLSVDCQLFFAWTDLPEEIRNLKEGWQGDRKYFDSYCELQRAVEDLIEAYEASFIEESKQKVIRYFVSKEDHGHDCKLDLGFRVLDKIHLGEDTFYQEYRKDSGVMVPERVHDPFPHSSNYDSTIREMDWTQEREDWFSRILDSMNRLSEEIERGISKRPVVLAKQIDNGLAQLMESKT